MKLLVGIGFILGVIKCSKIDCGNIKTPLWKESAMHDGWAYNAFIHLGAQ
jgi:hypothetical protein